MLLRLCGSCGVAKQSMAKCSGCKVVNYCTSACQRSHWESHKTICKAAQLGGPVAGNELKCVEALANVVDSKLKESGRFGVLMRKMSDPLTKKEPILHIEYHSKVMVPVEMLDYALNCALASWEYIQNSGENFDCIFVDGTHIRTCHMPVEPLLISNPHVFVGLKIPLEKRLIKVVCGRIGSVIID